MPELPSTTRTVRRKTSATPAQVWRVLSDGWSYATWVVGASRVREVDPAWPAEGAKIHHSFGLWPVLLNDESTVLVSEKNRHLRLQAEGDALGEATVDLTLTPQDGGTLVEIREDATRGPGRLVPSPLRQLAIVPRNVEALRRLCLIAEGRAKGH